MVFRRILKQKLLLVLNLAKLERGLSLGASVPPTLPVASDVSKESCGAGGNGSDFSSDDAPSSDVIAASDLSLCSA